MEATVGGNSDAASAVQSECSVRCTEEVLLPFFTDKSQPVAMERVDVPSVLPGVLTPLHELRLVLLGRKGAGKSSAGNTILGGTGGFESGKPTEECVKRRADVARRRVTVVDTPGWEWYYPLNSTPEWVRRETLRSVTLCPPGPHAVVLVVRSCASVTEDYTAQIDEHLALLGNGVWDHTMLLFTRGDELGLASIEQRILTSGPALQGLLQRCGGRYHVLDNSRSKGGKTQVVELLRKMEEAAERTGHLAVDSMVLSGLEADAKRRARERRKKQRQLEAQTQRNTIRAALMSDGPEGPELDARQSFSKGPRRLPELRLLLLGERETGKSSSGNTILGAQGCFFRAGAATEECSRRQAEVCGRLVTVVDSPGWEGGAAGPTPERVRREVAAGAGLCPPGPHAILLALRVDTLVAAAPVTEHLEMLGAGAWRHALLLFTHGDQLRPGVGIEQHIGSGGRDLCLLLEKCRGRYHVISNNNNNNDNGSSQVAELLDKVEKMAAGNRCEAFSGLVQEVRELGRMKNDRFNQRVRDLGEKLQRQEAELRKMREREVRSIRWFFDRKKKRKATRKEEQGVGEEAEEDEEEGERGGGRKRTNNMVELEERMRWLTEDKERELQDLSSEHERTLAEVHRGGHRLEETSLQLELRERELDEQRERLDEQQAKILELERAAAEEMEGRKRREEEVTGRWQAWAAEAQVWAERVDRAEREKAELRVTVEALQEEIAEVRQRGEEARLQGEREDKINAQRRDRQLVEMECSLKETGVRLRELESEVDTLKVELGRALQEKQAALEAIKQREEDMEREMHEMKSQHLKEMTGTLAENEEEVRDLRQRHEAEMSRKIREIEKRIEAMKIQHQEDIDRVVIEKEEARKRVEHRRDDELRGAREEAQRVIKEMKQQLEKDLERDLQERERRLEKQFKTQMEEKTEEHKREKEKTNLSHKTQMTETLQEKEKEIAALRKEHADKMNSNLREHENNQKALKHSLENKEREIELINQRVKQMAEQLQERERDEVNYQLKTEQKLKDNTTAIAEMNLYIRELEETLKSKDEEVKTTLKHSIEVEQQLQQNAAEMKDINKNLQEKQAELERFKQQAETSETKWREEQIKKDGVGKQEINRLIRVIEEKTQEVTQSQQLVSQREKEIQEVNGRCSTHLEELKQLKEKDKNATSGITEIQHRYADQEKKREAETTARLREKDDELNSWRQRDGENEREIALLRKTIEQTKAELTQLTSNMERETTNMIKEYEGELASKKEEMASILKDKEQAARKMQQTEEDGKRHVWEITGKYEEAKRTAQALQEEYDRTVKQLENLKSECDELKERCEAQQSREEESRELLSRYAEQLRATDSESCNLLHEKALELTALKETNDKLQREMKKWMERAEENECQVEKTKDLYETRLAEKQKQLDTRNDIIEKEFAEREREMDVRDFDFRAKEETLNKRASELDAKQEAVSKKEGKLEIREQRLAQWHVNLDIKQRQSEEDEQETRAKAEEMLKREQNMHLGLQRIEKREREVESFLQELETKQSELNTYGLDIQKKVNELRDWGKGLEDKEQHLKNEEQEILRCRAQLEKQKESVTSKHRQLDGLGKDLAKLQEDLRGKEKEALLTGGERERRPGKRETKQSRGGELRRPDADRHQVDGGGGPTGRQWEASRSSPSSSAVAEDTHATYQEVGTVVEEGWGPEKTGKRSDTAGREDKREETAEDNSSQLESPGDVFEVCEEDRVTNIGVGERVVKTEIRDKGGEALDKRVTADSEFLLPGQGQRAASSRDVPRSELRLVILAEDWSSRCPAGAAILGRDTSRTNGSPEPKPWRGQVAGRCVCSVEPPGLRWRNGPETTNTTEQSKRILESVSQLNPGPHVVLLVIPAYLTCTRKYRKALEEHMGLLGEDIWGRTLVLFTWGETLGESAEQHILRNGDLMRLVEKCGGRYHLLTSKRNNLLLERLFVKMEEMVAINNEVL